MTKAIIDTIWTRWLDWKSRLNTGQTLKPKIFSASQNSRLFQGFSENLSSHDITCWVITSESQRDESQTFFCLSVRFEPYYSAGPQRYTYKVSIQQQQQQYSESVFIRSSQSQMLEATVSANQAHCKVLYHTTTGKYKHFDPRELHSPYLQRVC